MNCVTDCASDDESDEDILLVDADMNHDKVFAKMMVEGMIISFQLDSGATINTLPVQLYGKITGDTKGKQLEKSQKTLIMYDKSTVKPVGERVLKVVNPKNKKRYKVRFVVVQQGVRPLLGWKAVQHMQLVTVNRENIAHVTQQSDVLTDFEDVFEGELGTLEGKLHLEVDPSVTPVKLPCRKWPQQIREKVKAEIHRLLELGVIQSVDTPTDWVSSLVVTVKPNGQARLCIDPKPLNKAIKRNDYSMKTIDDALEEMKGARFFTHLDAKNGFWHVELDDESSFLTTFETPFGKFKWVRLPFGISASPEEFQRRIDQALQGLPGSFAVHDDFIVWGKGATDKEASEDHDRNLKKLLERCREKGIKLNPEKTEYKKTEIAYLGHIISRDGLKVDPKKVDAIQNLATPTDKAGVQRLLGMVGYLQRFAPKLSEVAAPLRELVCKDIHFRWDVDVHGKALEELKKLLSKAPVLAYFDPKEDDVSLQCDASEFGLGACLMTKGQPVQYASRALTQTERNYAQIEKEMLSIVFGL